MPIIMTRLCLFIMLVSVECMAMGLANASNMRFQPHQAADSSHSFQTRQQILKRIKGWDLSGKVALHTAKDSGSATITWSQQGRNRYQITLSGPLGSHTVKLSGHPGKVILTLPDGKQMTAASPEQLLSKGWGFHLPVSYLNYWVRGLPVPNVPYQSRKFDRDNRLSDLRQDGWTVHFLNYTVLPSMDLPNKLYINSPTLNIKLIIYQWRVYT